eukprot:scaffold54536_cov34-Cyclotella_meneghiniana.AAC.1
MMMGSLRVPGSVGGGVSAIASCSELQTVRPSCLRLSRRDVVSRICIGLSACMRGQKICVSGFFFQTSPNLSPNFLLQNIAWPSPSSHYPFKNVSILFYYVPIMD